MWIEHKQDVYVVNNFQIEQLFNQKPFCIIDFEATGADAKKDYITQIGALLCEYNDQKNSLEIINEYCSFVSSPIPISDFIASLTHITNEDIANAPPFNEAVIPLFKLMEGNVVITQAGFEFDFLLLEKECERHHREIPCFNKVDIKVLFTWLHPEITTIISTNTLTTFYELDVSLYKRHHALGDCHIILNIFNNILLECKKRGIASIHIETLSVKKFKL